MNPKTRTITLIGILILLVIAAAFLLSLSSKAKQQRLLAVDTFEECALAGYPIMESYPERCATPDGRSFTNTKQDRLVPPQEEGVGIERGGCVIGGCSAQLCTEASEGPAMSDCMYRPEYACYKTARCERQASGECGWTRTSELSQCLPKSSGGPNPENLDQVY